VRSIPTPTVTRGRVRCGRSGPYRSSPATESYLRIDRILEADAPRRTGDPSGYGFLSENADFAAACATPGGLRRTTPHRCARSGTAQCARAGGGSKCGAARSACWIIRPRARCGAPHRAFGDAQGTGGGGGIGMRVVREEISSPSFQSVTRAPRAIRGGGVFLENSSRRRATSSADFRRWPRSCVFLGSGTARCSGATRRSSRKRQRRAHRCADVRLAESGGSPSPRRGSSAAGSRVGCFLDDLLVARCTEQSARRGDDMTRPSPKICTSMGAPSRRIFPEHASARMRSRRTRYDWKAAAS